MQCLSTKLEQPYVLISSDPLSCSTTLGFSISLAMPVAGTIEDEGLAEQQTPGWRDRVRASAMWGIIACGAGLFSDGYINAVC